MMRSILSVGGFTLLSRVSGLVRDIIMGAVLGAGFAADAFVVAFRLPNHFRAIFGEGAFNAAYVPAYAGTLEREGAAAAHVFSDRIFTLLFASQIVLLALALAFTPQLVDLLAPGFREDRATFELAVALTRITFPYLLCITLVTLQTGTLNAHGRFAAGAFAPVLLNLCMVAALLLSVLFPSAGHAAAWGVLGAGVAQLLLVSTASYRAGLLERFARPRADANIRKFFKALGPAVIGSAGVQIALFADTIIGSLLPTGGVSSIYYADRLYQLPIGVIGIAAGTVLLPQMSRSFAAGDPHAAFRAQNRTLALSLALAMPCLAAFLTIPDLLVRAVFLRGRFTEADAGAAASVLAAYAIGLLPIVMIASARASFQSRGDTTTPMAVALAGVAVNVALKVVLFQPLGAPGLALATAAGAWVNIAGLVVLAVRGRWFQPDAMLGRIALASAAAGLAMAVPMLLGRDVAVRTTSSAGAGADVLTLLALGLGGLAIYALVFVSVLRMLGVDIGWLRPLKARRRGTS